MATTIPRLATEGTQPPRRRDCGGRLEPEMRDELAQLYTTHAPHLRRFLVARGASADVVDDVLSAVFEDAMRHIAKGRREEVTIGWLTTVAKRRLIDHWRRSKRHRQVIDAAAEQPRYEHTSSLGDRQMVIMALSNVSDRQRSALMLRYGADLTVGEVAHRLRLSYKAAESLLARARRAFEQAYVAIK